jgi:membrane associated rhomboid family serine protease
MENFSITLLLIVLTCITSIMALKNNLIKGAALFYPYAMRRRNEWYRFITSGFIHADYMHLAVNMFVLYSFGVFLEKSMLDFYFGEMAGLVFVAIYLLGMIVSDIPTYLKHKNDPSYRGLGASGAVAAVLFSFILLSPIENRIQFMFVPGAGIPPALFGLLYLLYSVYMSRNSRDNVNHDAHFYGALFGFVFTGLLKPELFINFVEQVKLQFV